MQCIQTYLLMYETLQDAQLHGENQEVSLFLSIANPFQIEEQNEVINRFIHMYHSQFDEQMITSEQAYHFVIHFLRSFQSENLLSCFHKCTFQNWQSTQEMMTH